MKKYDITALGELLIDFTENGLSGQGNPLYEANPGGAPCNVLAMAAKLGYSAAFIGKVGRDHFGDQLRSAVRETGIESDYLLTDDKVHTTLAMVHTLPGGDREFSFYRNPGADMMLDESEIPEELIRNSRFFHFGSLSMTHEGVRKATRKAVRLALEAGCICSFDPNLRPPLWKSPDEAREQILWGLGHCHVLKISDNEIRWLTGLEDYTDGVRWVESRYHIPLILVSMGRDGSRAYYKNKMTEVPAFLNNGTIETTGAGDTFMGCMLGGLIEKGLGGLTEDDLYRMLVFANAGASLITTRRGALKVMPEKEEIMELIERGA